jgi:hypothetical protein
MVEASRPHSTHKALLIASVAANLALALALQKGWLNSVSDEWVAVVILISILSLLWWLWIHPSVKKHRYLMYTRPKMSLATMMIVCGCIGVAVGGFLWWATQRQRASAEPKIENQLETIPSLLSPSPTPLPSKAPGAVPSTSPAVLSAPVKQRRKAPQRNDTEDILLGKKKWQK